MGGSLLTRKAFCSTGVCRSLPQLGGGQQAPRAEDAGQLSGGHAGGRAGLGGEGGLPFWVCLQGSCPPVGSETRPDRASEKSSACPHRGIRSSPLPAIRKYPAGSQLSGWKGVWERG